MMNEQRFDKLLAGYLDDDLSHEETTELHDAVNASEDYRRRFQEETRLNILMRETLSEQVELQSLSTSVTPPAKSQLVRRVAIVTAAALLLAAVGGYFVSLGDTSTQPGVGICMSVSNNTGLSIQRGNGRHQATPEFEFQVGDQLACDAQTQAMLRLTDGSIVSMEPGAELVLDSDLPSVTLQQGVAFFEIAPREAGTPPFEVTTDNSTVAVMGTVFSVSASTHTELKVYEGSVTFMRTSDKAVVEVGSQQMATTERLAVEDLTSPTLEVTKLVPTDDLTLNRGRRVTKDNRLKVEGKHRIAYLRFVIPPALEIRSAKLRLKQDVDSGSGTLRFFVGSHSDWTEATLNRNNAPAPLQEVAQHTGVVGRGQSIEVDVTKAIQSPGPLTIIMTLDETGENDIWFAGRESDSPPELILTRSNRSTNSPAP